MLLLFLVLVLNSLNNLQNKKQILDQLKMDTVNAIDQPWQVELSNLQNQINQLKNAQSLDKIYPVGSIYITTDGTNPGNKIGGTWVGYGQGRTLIGTGTAIDNNNESRTFIEGNTGGEYRHLLTVNELASHSHNSSASSSSLSGTFGAYVPNGHNKYRTGDIFATTIAENSPDAPNQSSSTTATIWGYGINYTPKITLTNPSVGGNQAHNNIQPYIAVYMWKRTA